MSTLRRSFLRSSTRQQFLNEYRYRKINPKTENEIWYINCKKCKKVIKQNDIKCDHIIPIVTTDEGWKNFDSFIMRLFCMKAFKGFPNLKEMQPLCKECHDKKSKREREERKKLKIKS